MTWRRAHAVLDQACRAHDFPAATAEVGTSTGPLWAAALGTLTYDAASTPTRTDTVFDLASLTKVLATATLAATMVERGELSLDAPLATLLPAWSDADRTSVAVRDLLEHCSGLPAHRRYFSSLAGREAFAAAICREPLGYPPRTDTVYSDPGFMLLGLVLEAIAERPLDQQFVAWRDTAVPEAAIAYRPPAEWQARTAPTEHDPWRGRMLISEVHDENAAALGGVAGHAGLFGTATGVGACARWWLQALRGVEAPGLLQPQTALVFARRSAVPGSSRALGWDTMLPTSSCGNYLSPESIGHTGFTGTSLWIDPVRDLYVALLTNRVHPTRANEGIQRTRRSFHDAVIEDLGSL